jgi:DNA-binding CsgD family transcriptional regulator
MLRLPIGEALRRMWGSSSRASAVHLANARMAHGARTALDAFGRFLLAASGAGKVLWCTPQAATLLQTVLKQKLMVTDREAEVLLWIARGKSNRDIAEILSLSPRTVNKHLEQIYTKLGVKNRASAAALAVRTLGIR